jgi:hypothetical protein
MFSENKKEFPLPFPLLAHSRSRPTVRKFGFAPRTPLLHALVNSPPYLLAQLGPTTRSLERLPGLFCVSSFQPTPAGIREPGPAAGPREAHPGSTLTARSPGHRRLPSSASVPCTTSRAPYLAAPPRTPRVP